MHHRSVLGHFRFQKLHQLPHPGHIGKFLLDQTDAQVFLEADEQFHKGEGVGDVIRQDGFRGNLILGFMEMDVTRAAA